MSKTSAAVKWTFQALGITAFVVVLVLALLIYYELGGEKTDTIDGASMRSIEHVLNAAGFGVDRLGKVVGSFESSTLFTGDGCDMYAMQLTHVSEDELLADSFGDRKRPFYRGDHLPQNLDKALEFCNMFSGGNNHVALPLDELRSTELYTYAVSIDTFDNRAYGAELIFVRPSDRMLYFYYGKL